MTNATKAEKILVVAIGDDGVKSAPIAVFHTKPDIKLPKRFSVRLDTAGLNQAGTEQVKIGNFELNLIATHGKEYVETLLTGFRRINDDEQIIVVCERFSDVVTGHVDAMKFKAF